MESFWDLCLQRFRENLTEQQFNTWIKPLVWEENDTPQIIAPNRFVLDWVKDKFGPDIQGWAEQHFDHPTHVGFCLKRKPPGAPHPSLPLPVVSQPKMESTVPPTSDRISGGMRLNPYFSFDNFVGGRANQLARAAALQVSENTGKAYNPLFIYGGVGLGKTHLLQAIGNTVKAGNPLARIEYIHANDYVNDLVQAYRQKSFDDFKRHYQSLDLLLIDDIQFFAGKDRTQEEFFYTFNSLTESHRQIVITCDTYPKDLVGFEDRLKSRFAWGLTVAIEPPELEMRVAILLKKALQEGVTLDESVAFFIGKQARASVRELEGALKRVVAYARFTEKPITLDLVKDALRDLIASTHRQVSIENIQKTVADYYKLKVGDMFSKKRTRNLARPRQIAMALAKELTTLSLPEIGESFGGRDHTTVLHACRKVQELREQDHDISREYLVLLQTLTS
jgi:chromosomal replication initiator protein